MEIDARSLLLGAGLFGMVVGVTVALVAGASYRECAASYFAGGADAVCRDLDMLRSAALAFVGLSGLVALVPIVSALREPGRPGLRLVWRR